jgi:hypothetical protein
MYTTYKRYREIAVESSAPSVPRPEELPSTFSTNIARGDRFVKHFSGPGLLKSLPPMMILGG